MPNEACCDCGGRQFGCPEKSTVPGGRDPVVATVRPNCVRSPGPIHAFCPAGGVPHRIFPSANSVWKIAAELSAGFPGTPKIDTRVLAICRVPLTLPRVFTTLGICA